MKIGVALAMLLAVAVNAQWTDAERNAGYVVFAHDVLLNLPQAHVPSHAAVISKLSCALAPDEYESVQLGIHAIGVPLDSIKVVVESELVVKIYHRIDPATKARHAAAAESSLGAILDWVPPEINLQRGDAFGPLATGDSVNFWFTFHAPLGTEAGTQHGKIIVRPTGKPETVLDLEITVRPFTLQRPRASFLMWMREDMLPVWTGGRAAPRETVLAIFKDIAAHGHNANWFYPTGRYDYLPPRGCHSLDRLMPLAQEAGLLDPRVPSAICGGVPGDRKGKAVQEVIAWFEAESRRRSLPEMLAFCDDEPQYPGDADAVHEILNPLRNTSMRTVMTESSIAGAYGYMTPGLCDVHIVHDGMVTKELLAEAARLGSSIGTYSYRIWREGFDPLRQRFYAGLYTWTHRLSGNWVWAYHHGHHRHAWFDLDHHEPMPVTGWEARREGIDDYRYLQMLEDSIAASPDHADPGGDPSADGRALIAAKATAWLAALRSRLAGVIPNQVEAGKPLALAEFNQIRNTAADYIERLGTVADASDRWPSTTHTKEEAAYRGRTVAACIVGLTAPDVTTRRAAAWELYERGPGAAAAAATLAAALADPDVRMPALHALEAIGPEAHVAVPEIAKLVYHPDPYIRIGAALALGEIGAPIEERTRTSRRLVSPHAALVAEPLIVVFADEFEYNSHSAGGILGYLGTAAKPAVPKAIGYLDREYRLQLAALGLITGLGPHAAAAVPKLLEIGGSEFKNPMIIDALAAIGPDAAAAVPALEAYGAEQSGGQQATALYALCCIRGNPADFQKVAALLSAPDTDKRELVERLKQLGAKAKPIVEEVRPLLQSKAFADYHEDLQAFLAHVEAGEVPGVLFEW
jgi:hypothetical protein